MHYTVYKITNRLNNKVYIGYHQTNDLDDGYMGSGVHLKNAQEKYGIENFYKEILFDFDNPEDMKAKERELVDEEFLAREDVYNLARGGGDGWKSVNDAGRNLYGRNGQSGYGGENLIPIHDQSEEIVAKRKSALSRAMTGKASNFKGKTHTDEWKSRQSAIMKQRQAGSKNSQFGSMWITNGIESKKISKLDIIPEGWYKGRKMK